MSLLIIKLLYRHEILKIAMIIYDTNEFFDENFGALRMSFFKRSNNNQKFFIINFVIILN